MARDEHEEFAQDNLGNSYRKIDRLRALEGNQGLDNDTGIAEVGSAETGTNVLLFSKPTHADQLIVDQIWGFNSVGAGLNTFTLKEATLDSNGNITSTEQRSVPVSVDSAATRIEDYEGAPFESAIAVESEFEGQVGVAVYSDHQEEEEPAYEQTDAP